MNGPHAYLCRRGEGLWQWSHGESWNRRCQPHGGAGSFNIGILNVTIDPSHEARASLLPLKACCPPVTTPD